MMIKYYIKKNFKNFSNLYFLLFLTFLFPTIIISFNLISKVAPSDPLQYVIPALSPEGGFPWLDRIVLWYFIRFISVFGISNEYLGGVATLVQTSILLFIVLFWLSKKFNILTSINFFFIFILCKYWLPLSTYTYPMQLLSLITIGSVLLFDFIKSEKLKYLFLGCATILAIFSKIQGFGFVFLVLSLILLNGNKFENLKNFIFGLIGFTFLFLCLMMFIDGPNIFVKLFNTYFSDGQFNQQFRGRGLSEIPDFLILWKEPILFFSFNSIIFLSFFSKFSKLRPLAILAFVQIFFLVLIYYFTKRGGPLITNYFLESITISFIFLAVLTSEIIKNSLKFFKISNYYPIGIFLIFLLFLIFLINFFYIDEIEDLLRFYYNDKENINFKVLWFLVISFVLFIFKFKKQFYFFYLSIFLFIFFENSHYSIKKTIKKKDWSEPYYTVSNYIKLNNENNKKNIIFHASLNRNSIEDAERRMRRIAFNILELNQREYHKYVCVGLKCNRSDKNTVIITDDLEYVGLLNQENFDSSILIYKNDNITLNKSVYLLEKIH